MLDRKRKTKAPCSGCFLHKNFCMCDLIPLLDLKTRVSLIIHHKELKRTTNTGRLAVKSLQNSCMHVRGLKDDGEGIKPHISELLTLEYETLLLFPCDEAEVLDEKFARSINKKVQLLIPDGNWRQASKVNTRYKEFSKIRRVCLPEKVADQHFLRTESMPNGMATLQAIAYAIGAFEGKGVQEALLNLYNEKLKRTLVSRGELPVSVLET